MFLAETGLLKLLIPVLFLFGLVALGVVVAIGAFSHDRNRRKQAEAARQDLHDYTKRSEERTVAHIQRSEEHYDRVEKLLGQTLRVGHDLSAVPAELLGGGFLQSHSHCGDRLHVWAALNAGKDRSVDPLGQVERALGVVLVVIAVFVSGKD